MELGLGVGSWGFSQHTWLPPTARQGQTLECSHWPRPASRLWAPGSDPLGLVADPLSEMSRGSLPGLSGLGMGCWPG